MFTLLALCVASALPAREDPRAWIYFDSRETDSPPRLELEFEGRAPVTITADRDAPLIAYLEDRRFPLLPQVGIDRRGQNRALLHFPLEGGDSIVRATVVLSLHPSVLAPSEPFPVALHVVTEAWAEALVCWSQAPGFEVEPVATFEVALEGGVVRIDVTALAREWSAGERENHGLLLQTSVVLEDTLTGRATGTGAAAKLDAELAGLFEWAEDLDQALVRAASEQREVLVLVSAGPDDALLTEYERLLFATAFSHPVLRETIEARFVPVRVRVSGNAVAIQLEGGEFGGKPLRSIGLELVDARPPALLVVTSAGQLRQKLTRLGAVHAGELLAWLGSDRSLTASGDEDSPAARYDRAARAGRVGGAQLLARLESDDPQSAWALKARARRIYPDLVEGYELLDRPSVPRGEQAILEQATRFLLESQLADGSFPMGHPPYEEHREGISALSALALHRCGEVEAAARTAAWLAERFASRPVEQTNSFSAAYFVDLQLQRHSSGHAEERDVQAAIAVLVGGQLANGAWSYSKRFGEGWKGGIGRWPKTELGRAHSINTAIALEVLTRAAEAGFAVDREALEGGRDALLAMRVAPARYTYTYPEPRIYETLDASISKAPAAELSLLRLGAATRDDLATAVEAFLDGREHLDAPRKLTSSWVAPHALSGYFHSCAYLHGTQAVQALGGERRESSLRDLRQDLLKRVDADGTWIDTIGLGRPYATAMAVIVIGMSRE